MSDRIFYFGCDDRPGHFLRRPNRTTTYAQKESLPWTEAELDGALCVGWDSYRTPREIQKEGLARLHHKKGWTAIAFWDRSVDRRYLCNSVFVAEGMLTFDEVLEKSRKVFHWVWSRFKFEVRQAGMTDRPNWCPHPTCIPELVTQDCACGGTLPMPERHGTGTNEYRICLRHSLETDAPWTFDLQVNETDLFGLRRIFHALDGKHDPWGPR